MKIGVPEGYRILVWDIETTDFKANFGHMLMWAAKFVGEDFVHYDVINTNEDYGKTPLSMMDDRHLVEGIIDLINQSDAIVHHYGDRFDLPFVNTRALEWGLEPPRPVAQIDTWRIARKGLAMTSNRLRTLAESFSDTQKGDIAKNEWKLAAHGDKKVLKKMLDYCIDDVLATEQVYLALRPLIRNHPYMGLAADMPTVHEPCPVCGSDHTQNRGARRTKCFVIRRHHCQSCGTWYDGKRKKVR
jgi:DNA polymerase elongation subunit (family B)